MQLKDYIQATLLEVVAAFEAYQFQAEIQFDVAVMMEQTLDGKVKTLNCDGQGVKITVIISNKEPMTV